MTITFWRDITTAPLASVAVTIIGSISGVRPTAIDSANSAASHQSPLVTPLITSTSGAITSMKRISTQLTRLMPAWKAVVPRSVALTRCASAPKKVRAPVCTISAVAVPLITLVPMNSRLSRSSTPLALPLAGTLANFSTGIASPVSADWLMNRSLAESSRQSAGIMSPADSAIRSPGTRSRIGTSMRSAPPVPSSGRSTVEVLLTIALSSSAALFERDSCRKRSTVDSTTMLPITTAAFMSSVT